MNEQINQELQAKEVYGKTPVKMKTAANGFKTGIGIASKPLVVQSDGTLLLEVNSPDYARIRDFLGGFAQLERTPEYVHTYRITPLSLWNAAAVGIEFEKIAHELSAVARYPVPHKVLDFVREQLDRFGRVQLIPAPSSKVSELILSSKDANLLAEAEQDESVSLLLSGRCSGGLKIEARHRGAIKQAMIKLGYPVEDLCGYASGTQISVALRTENPHRQFSLRQYQIDAVDAFHVGGGLRGGAGVVVLPCGSGKTIVGLAALVKVGARTLVLTTSTVAVHQWIDELLDKTTLQPEMVGEYTGGRKEIKPVTIATYQMLTHRQSTDQGFPHIDLIRDTGWGLIIYDEVHMLPAPVFSATAEIQARRRLGLTATLVREDGREDDVFALIGPKRFEVPWRSLEEKGFIAQASCTEVRVEVPNKLKVSYALALRKDKFRLAAENKEKIRIVKKLIAEHPFEPTLVIGQYIDQLEIMAKDLNLPLITGSTPNSKREELFNQFRSGEIRVLIVSKIANFAINLPDASVLIQISGAFGSRQEEAQRLGRILRPKARPAKFYTVVSHDTVEQEFARKRQIFLVEQGYQYKIVNEGDG